MKDNRKIGAILRTGLFALVLCLSAGAQAAPLLLPLAKDAATDAAEPGNALYALNKETAAQLWQSGSFSVTLPVNGREVEFQQTERLIRAGNLTWRGVDASGQLSALLTLGPDHVYGQVFGPFGAVAIAPEGSQVRVRQLDPAQETPLQDDALLPPPVSSSASVPASAAAAVEDGSRIDVMVLYTNGLAAAHPGSQINTLIQNVIDQSNLVFSNSAVSTQFNLVHAAMVTYPDDSAGGMNEALKDLTDNLGVFSGVEALRTTYGADQVVLLRRYVDEGCGLAWVLHSSSPDYAYAVVHVGNKTDSSGYYCADTTYVHEIGHNLGCAHDRANAGSAGRFDYSYGYQSPSATFRTVMAYDCPGGCPRVLYFSNPDLQYSGEALGVSYTASNSADNARTINQTRVEMANYRTAAVTTWTVTPSAGAGGSISPDTPQTVAHGATASFTVTPFSGWRISSVSGCGGTRSGGSYTTGPVTADCAVTASFAEESGAHGKGFLPVYKLLLNK
ncbi:MAG: M12 family metallo-peptidase [Candidatus Electronema sp. VV]